MSIRVLVVDDAPFMREQIRSLIESEGFEVVAEVSDGLEAIEACEKHHPDLILMDVVMPRLDGVGAVECICQKEKQACVVMCSVLGQETQVMRALEAGATDFVMKPYQSDDVLRTLRKICTARSEA